jgi:hypothetical protein
LANWTTLAGADLMAYMFMRYGRPMIAPAITLG